jgi:sortase A
MMATEVERAVGAPPPSPSSRHARRKARWRLPAVPLAIAVVCLAGAGLLLYPMVAAWFSQYEQSQRIIDQTDDVRDLGADTLRERLAEARDYNAALADPGAALEANERLPLASGPEDPDAYASLLRGSPDGLMARLTIPAIDVDLPIYHGTSEWVLEHGVGHLAGTALPVGGESTHAVLTGHRGLASAELFTNLDRVDVGDTFRIEVYGEVMAYRVIETAVVEPEDTQSLNARVGEDLVTLVTCTPLGVNSHRILVTGERVIPTPQRDLDAAGEDPEIPTFPWWIVISGGVLAAAVVYVWHSGRPPRIRGARAST